MTNGIDAMILENMTGHHAGAGGLHRRGRALLYCGKCHKPKEAYFAPKKPPLAWA